MSGFAWFCVVWFGLFAAYLVVCAIEVHRKGVSTLNDGCEPFGGEVR